MPKGSAMSEAAGITPQACQDRPWISFYAPGVPSKVEKAPFRLLGDMARDLARKRGRAKAFTTILPNGMAGSLSFAQVDFLSDAFAAFLREDLRLAQGDRVAIQIPNGLAYPIIAFGVFKAGCILVNVNPLYTAHEMAYLFSDAEPAAIIAIDMLADKLAAALEIAPIAHVILTQAAELFPLPRRFLVGFVQKRLKKQIPHPAFPHITFARALSRGTARIRQGLDVARYSAALDPSAIACLQYTGGTTGVSKAAMLSHSNLIMNVAQFVCSACPDVDEKDRVLTVLPLYHVFAFTVNFLGFFSRGGHNFLVPNPRPLGNLRKAFEKYEITIFTGVNTLFNGLLNESWFRAHPPRSLRRSWAGGMSLQTCVAKRWQDLVGSPVIEGYGLTECSPVVAFNPTHRPKPGTIGVPLPSTEVKCVDGEGHEVALGEAGELVARGPQTMAGYWRQPGETANVLRDGWLHTGDIATMDAEGYFTLVDRAKDMILVSGFNVYPNEVEGVLAGLPGVKECAVIGVPDAASGEVPQAFVVRSDPALTAEAVRRYCKKELASYKVPRHIEFRDDLPKSNVGKILRKDLRLEAAKHRKA